MYNFIDSIDEKFEPSLPSEAVYFDGKSLDLEIKGFRTLYVLGRQSIPIELSEINASAIDGSRFRKRKYKPRIITVGYQIKVQTPEELIKVYDQLLFHLSPVQKRIQFVDDSSRFYIGTISEISDPPSGKLFFNSEFRFYCPDPFKYSNEEFSAAGDAGTLNFYYRGTYKAYPEYILTLNGVTSEVTLLNGNAKLRVAAKTDNFADGTIIRLRCSDGNIFINDVKSISYGDVENDWDAFALMPGENSFTYEVADGESLPDLTVEYRAVYL